MIESDSSEWVKGVARERVRLANDRQVKDRSFCASTVARLVLGGSRATYRLRLPITPSLFFEVKAFSILFLVWFLHKNTERPASQSCSLPSPKHSVESGSTVCSDSIGSSHNLRLLLVYNYGETKLYFRDWTLLLWLDSTSKKLFPSQVPWIHVFLVGPKWMNEEARPGRLQELLLCLSSYNLFRGS